MISTPQTERGTVNAAPSFAGAACPGSETFADGTATTYPQSSSSVSGTPKAFAFDHQTLEQGGEREIVPVQPLEFT